MYTWRVWKHVVQLRDVTKRSIRKFITSVPEIILLLSSEILTCGKCWVFVSNDFALQQKVFLSDCVALYCTALRCIVLYCVALHCIALHSTLFYSILLCVYMYIFYSMVQHTTFISILIHITIYKDVSFQDVYLASCEEASEHRSLLLFLCHPRRYLDCSLSFLFLQLRSIKKEYIPH